MTSGFSERKLIGRKAKVSLRKYVMENNVFFGGGDKSQKEMGGI